MPKYIHWEFKLFIFRFSFYMLGRKKLNIRFEISWGWEE